MKLFQKYSKKNLYVRVSDELWNLFFYKMILIISILELFSTCQLDKTKTLVPAVGISMTYWGRSLRHYYYSHLIVPGELMLMD